MAAKRKGSKSKDLSTHRDEAKGRAPPPPRARFGKGIQPTPIRQGLKAKSYKP